MEAGTLTVGEDESAIERAKEAAGRHPARTALVILAALVVVMVIIKGVHLVAEVGLAGLSTGAIYALGAVGLTLVYGILKLVNFAHGDFLTFGAYMAYLANVTWGLPLWIGILFAMVAVAVLGIVTEKTMWAPMRAKRAGLLQLVLMSIGLAFLIRSVIQFIWGTEIRQLDVSNTATVDFLGLSIGRTQLITIVIGIVVIAAVGVMLRYSLLGKRMRALSDDLDLAETAGIDTVPRDPLHLDLRRGARGPRRGAGRRQPQPQAGARLRAAAADLRRRRPRRDRRRLRRPGRRHGARPGDRVVDDVRRSRG